MATEAKKFPYDQVYLALGLLAFACWCLLILGPPTVPGRGLDFRIFYTAAALPLEELYDFQNQATYQQELWKQYGSFVTSPFPRPAFYALLLTPLALLDYGTALHLWLVLIAAATVAGALMIRRLYGCGLGVFFLLISFYPISVALRSGQDSAFILLAALLSIHFHRGKREWLAAICLAFVFQKFNMAFLIPVVLLLQRKTSLLVKLAAVVGGLALVSVASTGLAGVRDYFELLTGGTLDERFWDAWNIRALVWRFGWNSPLYAVLTVAGFAWFAWLLRKLEFETAFWLSFMASLVVSWHCYCYDFTVALPFAYLAWSRHRVYLAGLALVGALWPHFYYLEDISWLVTVALILMTVELWWKSRPPSGSGETAVASG